MNHAQYSEQNKKKKIHHYRKSMIRGGEKEYIGETMFKFIVQ